MAQSTTSRVQHVNASGQSKVQVGNNYIETHNHIEPSRIECLADLRLTDPRDDKERIQDTKGGLLRDSYRWILDHDDFQRWRDDPQSQLLWIKGDPGKGKTMLLCGIIDELKKEPDIRLSYFFCQATEEKLSNATAVLRGLIYLLVVQEPSLISHVRKKHDHAGRSLFEDSNAWYDLREILIAILKDPVLKSTIIIIDALDECVTGLQELLKFIIEQSSLTSCVKWIVSSRNFQDIEEKLGRTKQKVRLQLELNQDSISKAVDTYIGCKVKELADLKNYDKETRDAVQRHLVGNADGTFLWVALVCQELADPKVRKRHTLDTLKSFPPGLDPLYKRMMEHISDSKDAGYCKEILAIASVVYRPITLDELKALAESLEDLDQDELKEIIQACGSFLTHRDGVIYFVHQSAKDFLLDKASDQILPLGAEHQHYAIFSRSLAALSQTLQRDVCKLNALGFPSDKVLLPVLKLLSPIRYSCVYWVDHLHDSDSTEVNNVLRDNGNVHRFIQEKYLYWLECLSLLQTMSEGVNAVHKLEDLVRKTEARQLIQLLRDARRFVLSHARAIEIAPLQAYASALVFSPEHSLIRELYKKEEPDWMILKPRMEADWNACVQTLEGHGDWVLSVVFSADGQRLASGSRDGTAKIWDAATGACVRTLGHGGWVMSVALSADGQRLASGSFDKTVRIWDAATGACVQTLEGHGDAVASVALSADGRRLASGSRDGTAKIWDAATGACVQTLEGHGGWVASVALSADGRRLASVSQDGTVRIWDAATGACVRTLDHGGGAYSVALSADGQRLASGSLDKTVRIWDAATGACVRTLGGHGDWVLSVALSADGQRLASGSLDKTVKMWDAATGACVQTLEGRGGWVMSVALSADGRRLASVSRDGTVKIWDAATGTGACEQTFEGHGGWVTSVALSVAKIWDAVTGTGACEQTLEGHDGVVMSVALSADGQWLASVSEDGTVKIWDAATGAYERTLEGHGGRVASVALSADGQRLASGSVDKTVKIWDAATGACVRTLGGHGGWVLSVALSADGQRLASGSFDKTVKIWDAATGACVQTLGHGGKVYSVALSADGRRLASGSEDGTVRIWDAATGACVRTLEGHGGWVASVALSADGRRLASGSGDGTVRIWDAATGACVRTLNVGRTLDRISFDPMTNSRLSTDIGLLNLELSLNLELPNQTPAVAAQLTEEAISQRASHSGYGISTDGVWVVKDGMNMLWLPPEYRPVESAVVGSTVAIGCRSGRVLIMKFS